MYRLMVVEDEDMIRKGIIKTIPWNEMGFEVVSEGRNGMDALDKLEHTQVDVLLTDIKMPVMDGTELSKRARKMYPDIEIVILSGFSDFEYARQAISFRAFDYLLKPTNKKKLLDAFTKLKEHMDRKKERREEIFHNSFYINAGYEAMRKDFLVSLLEGQTDVFSDFDEKSDSLELDFTGAYFTAATLKFDRKSIYRELENSWETDKKLMTFSYNNIVKEALNQLDNVYYVINSYDTISFIFCFETMQQQERMMENCLQNIGENIQNCLFKRTQIPYMIGVGLTYPTIQHIAKSYTQSLKSIKHNFYVGEKNIQVYSNQVESAYEKNYIMNYPEEMKIIVKAVADGNQVETRVQLNLMFDHLNQQQLLPEIVKNYCSTLMLMVESKIGKRLFEIGSVLGEKDHEFIKEALTVNDLKKEVIHTLVNLAGKIDAVIGKEEADDHKQLIEKAQDYIKSHLGEKITLTTISEHVFLSETYFSFLFKKVTGITYMDYIQQVRMDEAKNLLASTNDKIYEVAEQIGYNDYKYFSSQFKKYMAMSPKEYRKLSRS